MLKIIMIMKYHLHMIPVWVITWLISFYTFMINILDSFYGNKNANKKISVCTHYVEKSLINSDGMWP